MTVSDSVLYLPLNSLLFLQQPSFTPGQGGLPPQVIFFNPENSLSNFFNGDLTYLLTEPTSLRLYGGYDLTRFRQGISNNSNGYRAGFQLLHRPTRRLTINTGYEHQDYKFDSEFASSKVDRLTVGFNYALSPTVLIDLSVGPELATAPGKSRVQGYFQGRVEKKLRSTLFAVQYQQGTVYDRSVATGLFSRGLFGSFSHRFGEKLRVGLGAGYGRNEFLVSTTSHINNFQGGPTLEYAIRPDLTFVASYFYLNQAADPLANGPSNLSRHFVSVGFEYRIPRLFR